MTYRQSFDRLGNPIYRPARFAWMRRITEATDADGVFIICGVITAIAIVGLWLSGAHL